MFVVTESTDEAAIKEQFSTHGSVKGFGENIFEVTHSTSPGATIVVAICSNKDGGARNGDRITKTIELCAV